ncbi:tRNA (5-methylaminomethyl-2-thiouridine)(34)-methyltransferase MnmD [Flavobacterium rhizosphaerae]|uniref:tRNA (5-methylaminomethyl-2-thiouridine)(34)-methyltransferase MnmD n=1 Tax=Flavobacterium rhizosphaerae TaxID=3163298 RepID=A0ABW8YX47_9FLAO
MAVTSTAFFITTVKREIITTEDGSVTIHLPEMNESYHSKFGAIQEAYHVFIQHGLSLKSKEDISILEIGFGTGLNAFITYIENVNNKRLVHYTGIEAYPVDIEEAGKLNYPQQLKQGLYKDVFIKMHDSPWGAAITLSNGFTLHKRRQFFQDIVDESVYDLVYFDAFGYHAQPDLWSPEIFKKMYTALKPGGILVTYACRTVIKNAMKQAGFLVEKLPGPPGKREMLRAIKN